LCKVMSYLIFILICLPALPPDPDASEICSDYYV
jgi:hypothetical protein